MKKSIILFVILISVSIAKAQNISDAFKTMPFEIVPGLTDEDKDILLIDTGITTITTPIGEISKLEQSDTYIKLRTSKVGTTQIKLLTNENNDSIVCVVKTVCGDACDSDIKFFTTNWEELDKNILFPNISVDLFLNVKGINDNISPEIVLPLLYPFYVDLFSSSEEMELRIDLEKALTKNQFKNIEPYILQESVTLKWSGKSFSYKK